MSDSVILRNRSRIIQSILTRGHKRTKCINIPSNHFQSTQVHPHKQYQLMSNIGCEAVALWLDKRSWNFSDSPQGFISFKQKKQYQGKFLSILLMLGKLNSEFLQKTLPEFFKKCFTYKRRKLISFICCHRSLEDVFCFNFTHKL